MSEPAHPAPWRWGRTEDGWTALLDANGRAIISYQGGGDMDVGTPEVQALVAIAPEMAALLRRLEWSGGGLGGDSCCPSCGAPVNMHRKHPEHPEHGVADPHEPGCELAALLARLPQEKDHG